jgi:hypothetical protein
VEFSPQASPNQAVVNYRQQNTTRAGQPAISYARELQELKLSRKLGKVIVTRERGLAILHPFLANTIVQIVFSETAPEDELHEAAFSQADNIINRVSLEPLQLDLCWRLIDTDLFPRWLMSENCRCQTPRSSMSSYNRLRTLRAKARCTAFDKTAVLPVQLRFRQGQFADTPEKRFHPLRPKGQ